MSRKVLVIADAKHAAQVRRVVGVEAASRNAAQIALNQDYRLEVVDNLLEAGLQIAAFRPDVVVFNPFDPGLPPHMLGSSRIKQVLPARDREVDFVACIELDNPQTHDALASAMGEFGFKAVIGTIFAADELKAALDQQANCIV